MPLSRPPPPISPKATQPFQPWQNDDGGGGGDDKFSSSSVCASRSPICRRNNDDVIIIPLAWMFVWTRGGMFQRNSFVNIVCGGQSDTRDEWRMSMVEPPMFHVVKRDAKTLHEKICPKKFSKIRKKLSSKRERKVKVWVKIFLKFFWSDLFHQIFRPIITFSNFFATYQIFNVCAALLTD